ncbi:MAG TPA: hypothetical protein VHW03_04115 [Chthoniobacterales bacterium]|nr:hypothetical protein [Chthoniobacterales bacterium]
MPSISSGIQRVEQGQSRLENLGEPPLTGAEAFESTAAYDSFSVGPASLGA